MNSVLEIKYRVNVIKLTIHSVLAGCFLMLLLLHSKELTSNVFIFEMILLGFNTFMMGRELRFLLSMRIV